MTGAAAWGGSPAKTTGKPFWAKKRWTDENTDGMGGSTLSKARTMRDCCTARSRLVYRLCENRLATSQVATSVATTATATPKIESTGPSRNRCSSCPERTPRARPIPPRMVATPMSTARAMTVLAVLEWASPANGGATNAPMNRPSQNPPKDNTCVAAPRRSPWMPDAATRTSNR